MLVVRKMVVNYEMSFAYVSSLKGVLQTFKTTAWLLGKHQNGAKCTNDKAAQRLLQTYVAMTRPTHLLCLALPSGSLGVGATDTSNQEKLIACGWRIQHLSPPAAAGNVSIPESFS